MVFWKFTTLIDHRHSFYLCRENQYGSSMIQCFNEISTQSLGKYLIIVILRLRSAETILKRIKSVNHCCTERVSMHCCSDPTFPQIPQITIVLGKSNPLGPTFWFAHILKWKCQRILRIVKTTSSEGTTSQYVEYKVACMYWCGMQCL